MQTSTDTPQRTEFDHGRISPDTVLEVELSALKPAAINDKIYCPVDVNDPVIRDMARGIAATIATAGPEAIDPIVITTDDVIVSGHRRRACFQILKHTKVRVRRLPIASSSPEFPQLLVSFNRQRNKSADEIFREELVRLNPADARRKLLVHREQAATVKLEPLVIAGTKKRAEITDAKIPFLNRIIQVLNDLHSFWPLSDRAIHYQLLNNPPLKHASKPESQYVNDAKSYKALTDLLTRARLAKYIPFEAIHDPTRPVVTWGVHPGVQPFIQSEVENFLKGYRRDLQRSQPLHVEIVGEKNTIESAVRRVAWDYSIPYTIGRGYSSLPPRCQIAQRFRASGKEKLLALFVSDYDPEGDDIAHSFARSIRDDFGIKHISAVKVALTRQQVEARNLPPLATAKQGSSRRKGFVERHGSEHVWELESLKPQDLQGIIRDVIEAAFDMAAYRAELKAEGQDAARLEAIRHTLATQLAFVNSTMVEFKGDGD